MRILVLTKRQYTNKDLIDDRYGRLYELPQELAKLGHDVAGLCLSYRLRDEGHLLGPEIDDTLVDWYSVSIGRFILPGLTSHIGKLIKICNEFKPNIIFACSDAFHVILGYYVAKKLKIPCVVDLYDNFESFPLTRLPAVLPFFKNAIKNADGVVCVSHNLYDYITNTYSPKGSVKIIPNGIPFKLFAPMDQHECRKKLGLPVKAKLIGTAGAIGHSRGSEVLFKAFEILAGSDPPIHLALAGVLEQGTKIPENINIHYVGKLNYDQVPVFINALDVGVICNRETSFGRYCFPQKAYEMFACEKPVLAADVGAMSSLLANDPESLYAPDDEQSLARAILEQLKNRSLCNVRVLTWPELAKELESFLGELV